MKVDSDVVSHIAELAQLKIDAEQMQNYVDSMQNILNLVEQMQNLDTQDVAPMANPLDGVQKLRADEVTEPNRRDHYQKTAPEIQDGLFLVPKVID